MEPEINLPNEMPPSFAFIGESSLKTFYLNKDAKTMIMVWKWDIDVDDMEYKDDICYYLELIKTYKVKFLISDTRKSNFTVSPDLLLWYAEEIVPKLYELGIVLCGVIVDQNLNTLNVIEEVSTNTIKIHGAQKIPNRYFQNYAEALEWLWHK